MIKKIIVSTTALTLAVSTVAYATSPTVFPHGISASAPIVNSTGVSQGTIGETATAAAGAVQANGGDASKTVVTPTGDTASHALSDVAAQATGSVQKTAIGAANGVAPLDDNKMMPLPVSGDVSAATVTPQGLSTVRKPSSVAVDTQSLRNYGARLDGSEAASAVNAAIAVAGEGSQIELPADSVLPSGYAFPDSSASGFYIHVKKSTTISDATRAGDGNLFEVFTNGTYWRSRYYNKNYNVRPIETLDYTNNLPALSTGWAPGHKTRYLHTTTTANSAGNTYAEQNTFDSYGKNGSGGYDGNIYHTLNKYGTNWAWNGILQTSHRDHAPTTYDGVTEATRDYNLELDLSGPGPDLAASAYDTNQVTKTMLLFNSWTDSAVAWTPNTAVSTGDARTFEINGIWQLFVAETGGTTGATAPSWVVDHTQTFTDGTVTWRYSTTAAAQIGSVIGLTTQNAALVSYGTFLSTNATFYNAIMDFSKASFTTPVHTVLRMPANAGIDLSADGTQAGQNKHWVGYSSGAGAFVYNVNGSPVFTVYDDGTVSLANTLALARKTKAQILAITNPSEGMTSYDTDDHAQVTYRCPTTSTCGWFPVQYGTALSN